MLSSKTLHYICKCLELIIIFSPKDSIYYHRELLCHSMDRLRIDLVTITSCHGMLNENEPHFDANLFPEKAERCKNFRGKRVGFFIMF